MKLGYFTMPVHPPARSYVATLKEDREAFILADRLGYTEGYCGEHLTDAAENIPNSMMFIATLLGVTSRMKVGTAVVNLRHTHPVVVASNAAMLDNLFEGRFILGIGAGILRSDAEALGLLDADRNAMFAEAIDHILALWAGTAPIDAALDDVGRRARDHERGAGRPVLAGVSHDLAMLRPHLQIVEIGDRPNRPPEHRVGGDVVDAAPRDPDLARMLAQAVDELLSVARCHQSLPKLRRQQYGSFA